jgi:ABC-type lipoprotein export system ATPase subunit
MDILERPIKNIKKEIPELLSFLGDHGIMLTKDHLPLGEFLGMLGDEYYEDIGIDQQMLIRNMNGFLKDLRSAKKDEQYTVKSVTIKGGHDKNNIPENVELTLIPGTVTSIVGPTGSGKSRLLADIEWMAQNDTPTGRTILINQEIPDTGLRFSLEHKLVAQLSQNMNFVIDTNVSDFIAMHAESRRVKNIDEIVAEIICQANLLAGEPFDGSSPLTSLSGGQSRALMIADTAFLSRSPVVLIDEIENAGIDRKKALGLLVRKEKIVLMATHDPILALMAGKRLVIKNGGIYKVLTTSEKEKANLETLEALDNRILALRNRLRAGEILDDDI